MWSHKGNSLLDSVARKEAKAMTQLALSQLPLELVHEIIGYLPPISSIVPSIVSNFTLRDSHTRVWHAIFRSDEYASRLASELGIKLVLLGNDVRQLYDNFESSRQSGTFIVLSCYDRDGRSKHDVSSLHKYNRVFRTSLQKHVLYGHGVVRLIDSNITLFVAENICPIEPTYAYIPPSLWIVPEPSKLLALEEGRIESACLYWDNTGSYTYVKLGDGDIIGPQERSALVKYSNIYLLRLLTKTVVIFRSSLFELSHIEELLSADGYTLDLDVPATEAYASQTAPWDDFAPLSVFQSLWKLRRRDMDAGSHGGSVSPPGSP